VLRSLSSGGGGAGRAGRGRGAWGLEVENAACAREHRLAGILRA